MIVSLLVLVGLVVVWRVRRRRRQEALGGLDALRPVFSVEPPRRRVGRLKDELL